MCEFVSNTVLLFFSFVCFVQSIFFSSLFVFFFLLLLLLVAAVKVVVAVVVVVVVLFLLWLDCLRIVHFINIYFETVHLAWPMTAMTILLFWYFWVPSYFQLLNFSEFSDQQCDFWFILNTEYFRIISCSTVKMFAPLHFAPYKNNWQKKTLLSMNRNLFTFVNENGNCFVILLRCVTLLIFFFSTKIWKLFSLFLFLLVDSLLF